MRVVTNAFGPKDLSSWHQNIVSVNLTAVAVSDAITTMTRALNANPKAGDAAVALRSDYLADGPLFPFADTLAERLGAGM